MIKRICKYGLYAFSLAVVVAVINWDKVMTIPRIHKLFFDENAQWGLELEKAHEEREKSRKSIKVILQKFNPRKNLTLQEEHDAAPKDVSIDDFIKNRIKKGLLYIVYCPTCGDMGSLSVWRIGSTKKVLQRVYNAEEKGLYNVEITGVPLLMNVRLKEGESVLSGGPSCFNPESTTENYQTARMSSEYGYIQISGNQFEWIGRYFNYSQNKRNFRYNPEFFNLPDRDMVKIKACEEISKEGFPTVREVLDSIESAGGKTLAYAFDRGSGKWDGVYMGVARKVEGSSIGLFLNNHDVSEGGKEKLSMFCSDKYVKWEAKTYNFEGTITCEGLTEEGTDSFAGVSLSLNLTEPPSTEIMHWGPLIISEKPFPRQTWALRKPTDMEIQIATEFAIKHLGRLGELDPPVYSENMISIVDTKEKGSLMIFPILDSGGEFINAVYLSLHKSPGEKWREIIGIRDQGLSPVLDLDGDGVPEFLGPTGYKSHILRSLYPEFRNLLSATSGV